MARLVRNWQWGGDEMGANDVVTVGVGQDKVVFLNLFGNDAERYIYFDNDQP